MALDKDGNLLSVPKPEKKSGKGGAKPRQVGKRAEAAVAKKAGGSRIPASGAIKSSTHDLKGDVRVPDADGRPYIKAEVKVSGTITPAGDRSFTLKRDVVEQMVKEAEEVGQLGILVIHWKGEGYGDDYVLMKAAHFYEFLDDAKTGRALAA